MKITDDPSKISNEQLQTEMSVKKAVERVKVAIEAIKNGEMVIMVDDEDRENEGDLVLAADFATPEKINFLAKEARGLICLTMAPELIDRLKLPMMEDASKTIPTHGTAFTVSIEARTGVTTGISAADRCRTIQVAIDDATQPNDIVVPGHIFPLKARSGGVLERAGHTEGSVDLARMSGCKKAGVICEIMNDDGTMARMGDLEIFSKKHKIPMVAIADLITYRLAQESLVEMVTEKPIQTSHGIFQAKLFRSVLDKTHHLVLTKGEDFENNIVDVRVHSQRQLVDVFGDSKKSGRFRVEYGLKMLAENDRAALLYLTRPQSADSLMSEIEVLFNDSCPPQQTNEHQQPFKMDARLHGTGAQILRSVGIHSMRVHTTSPRTLKGLSGFGLEIIDSKLISEQDNEA